MEGLLAAAAAALAVFVLDRVPLPSACTPIPEEPSIQAEEPETQTPDVLPVEAAAATTRNPDDPEPPTKMQQQQQEQLLQEQQANESKVQQQQQQQQGSSRASARRAAAATVRARSAAGVQAAGEASMKGAAAGRGSFRVSSRGTEPAATTASEGVSAEAASEADWIPPPSPLIPVPRKELILLLVAERKRHKRLLRLTRVLLVATLLLAVMLSVLTTEAGKLRLRGWAGSLLTEDFWKASGSLADRFAAAKQQQQQQPPQQNEELQQLETQAMAAANREAAIYRRMQKEMLTLHSRIELLEARNKRLSADKTALEGERAKLEKELGARGEDLARAVVEKIQFKADLEQALDSLKYLQRVNQGPAGDREAQRSPKGKGGRDVSNPIMDDFGSYDGRGLAAGGEARGSAAGVSEAGLAGMGTAASGSAGSSGSHKLTRSASTASVTGKGAFYEGQGDSTSKSDAGQKRWSRHGRNN